MGRCRSLGLLKSFFWYASYLSRASILIFPHPEFQCWDYLQFLIGLMTTAFFVYWNGRQHSLSTHCYGQKEPISLKVFCCLYPLHSFITLATRSSLVQGWKTKERQIWKGNSGTVLVLIVSQGLIFFLSACCFSLFESSGSFCLFL